MSNLSVFRFQHRFREETGLPYRRYRAWRRMAAVVLALSTGATLNQAALKAGFASSSQLSAAFLAIFGIQPSLLVRVSGQSSLWGQIGASGVAGLAAVVDAPPSAAFRGPRGPA